MPGTKFSFFEKMCRDPNFGKYFSVKEGLLSLFVEYIIIYNKIEEFIWK